MRPKEQRLGGIYLMYSLLLPEGYFSFFSLSLLKQLPVFPLLFPYISLQLALCFFSISTSLLIQYSFSGVKKIKIS